jgi:hypothetical protein
MLKFLVTITTMRCTVSKIQFQVRKTLIEKFTQWHTHTILFTISIGKQLFTLLTLEV